MSKFSCLYREGHSNFQSDFASIVEWSEWIDRNDQILWAVLVRVRDGIVMGEITRV